MKIFRFVINIPFILFILYGTIMNFAIYDNDCEHFVSGIIKSFNFMGEIFFIGFIIIFCFNLLNERKIEREKFHKSNCKTFFISHHCFCFHLYYLCD